MKYFLMAGIMCLFSSGVAKAQNSGLCCVIIDMNKESGTFTLRDKNTGRITLFKPDALEGAELRVGDSADASITIRKITSVKGIAKTYDLIEPEFGEPCCTILQIEPDVKDTCCSLITAKNNTTGESFRFKAPKTISGRFTSGGVVFTQTTHGYAMLPSASADSADRRSLYGFPMLQQPGAVVNTPETADKKTRK